MKQPLSLPRGKAAAIFIDLQEEHRGDPRYLVENYMSVLANARRLQQAARAAGVPIYHCAYKVERGADGLRPFHPVLADGTSAFSDGNDPLTEICAEVGPERDEPLLIKSQASAFGAAALEPSLRAGGTEWLIVAGVWTEACVDATVKGAIDRGFRVLLVKDACGSGTDAMHRTAILNLANRLYGGALTDTDGACRLMSGATVDVWRVQGAVPLRFGFDDAAALYDTL
ncbi:MAG: isochorismatase family protein [Mesorhizobium sp.]|nr:isochorismatase family protein [Mesorhizobium sp.]